MFLPKTWGEGALFAPSGLDVPTDHARPCVGSLLGDGVGMRIHALDAEGRFQRGLAELRIELPGLSLGSYDRARAVVAGDVIDLRAFDRRLLLVAAEHGVFVGKVEAPADGAWLVTASPAAFTTLSGRGEMEYVSGGGGTMALRLRGNGCFAMAVNTALPERAAQKVVAALDLDLDALRDERLRFFAGLRPPALPDCLAETYAKAASVLRVNVESAQGCIPCRWTTPDKFPHRHMWIWDSAFHALGWRCLDRAMAVDAIAAVLAQSGDDGFIPITMTPHGPAHAGCSQPPILGWALAHVIGCDADARAEWERLYPPLARFVRWMLANRPGTGRGLHGWLKNEEEDTCRCGESGIDNGAQFDHPGPDDCVDLVSYVVADMEVLERVARLLDRNDEAGEWRATCERLVAAANEALWDEARGVYLNRDRDGNLVPIRTQTCFLPLYAGIPDVGRAARLVEVLKGDAFARPLPVPSLAADEPQYGRNMWRGPTWINTNYFIAEGLRRYGYEAEARRLAGRSMVQIARWYHKLGVLVEYYDAEAQCDPRYLERKADPGTGRAVIRDYGWTAACYIAFAHEYGEGEGG